MWRSKYTGCVPRMKCSGRQQSVGVTYEMCENVISYLLVNMYLFIEREIIIIGTF